MLILQFRLYISISYEIINVSLIKIKSFAQAFKKLAVSKGKVFGHSPQMAKYFILPKAQEGRKHSIGMFFVVNPRRRFTER
ncbi:MAG: hypothetical protein ACLU24_08515 [Candidatus Pseudoruminococcus sp.]